MRFLPVGPRTLLVELADLDATLALFDALLADPIDGVAEIIPAARTLMIRVAPGFAADGALAAAILDRLIPNTFGRLMTLANIILPGPTGASGDESWPGHEARPAAMPRVVTALSDRAARRNNELLATS